MTDIGFDDEQLIEPADLWPDPVDTQVFEQPRPPVWVWHEMEPPVRRQRFLELSAWTSWLVRTFPKVQAALPKCWYQHRDVREHLTALYAAYVRAYIAPSPGADASEAVWLSHLHALTPHLVVPKCASGHEEAPARTKWEVPASEVEAFLDKDDFGTSPAEPLSPGVVGELLTASQEPPL